MQNATWITKLKLADPAVYLHVLAYVVEYYYRY